MIGAGGQAGQNDAANLLKPALARGELRTIAATTWSEYKKYFEKDAALARRFQVVKVEEPAEAQCMVMLRGIVPALEKHHNVRILDEGLAGGSATLASLSGRPPVAGQSGQRAGYRLRAPGAGPELDPAGHRGRHRGARRSGRADARFSSAKPRWAPIMPSGWPRLPRKRRTVPKRRWPALRERWEKERDAGRANPRIALAAGDRWRQAFSLQRPFNRRDGRRSRQLRAVDTAPCAPNWTS